MPPKSDAAPAAKPEAGAPAAAAKPEAAAAAAPAKGGGLKALLGLLIPVVLVAVLAPAGSWAVAQFVLLPKFEKKLAAAIADIPTGPGGAAAHGAVAHSGGGEKGEHGKKGEPAAGNTYEFSNMVVNLAGTMGTRYLKTTFLVTGTDNALRETFITNKAKLVDITLNVLSSLSLAELEEAGAKNIIRERLVNSYNQAFGRKVAEQIYFSDFVVQ